MVPLRLLRSHMTTTTFVHITIKSSDLKTQSLVESISSALVLGSQTLHESLGISASRLGGVVGTTDVDELVAHKVGDDVGVEGITLATVGDEGVVGREEGALVCLAVELSTAELEVDGGCAVAKVGVSQRRGCLGRDGGDESSDDDVVLHLDGLVNYLTDVLLVNECKICTKQMSGKFPETWVCMCERRREG